MAKWRARTAVRAFCAVGFVVVGLAAVAVVPLSDHVRSSVVTRLAAADAPAAGFWSGGYAPPGTGGHGRLLGLSTRAPVPVIVDGLRARRDGAGDRVIKRCLPAGAIIDPTWDIDFFYAHGRWYKLRRGALSFLREGPLALPVAIPGRVREAALFGWQTPALLNVERPFYLYRLKIMRDRLAKGALSPKEYLGVLARREPSCVKMPELAAYRETPTIKQADPCPNCPK
ncbi:MAG: hypothetical protein AAFQ29_00825 [Pseudomonadota bacterium]